MFKNIRTQTPLFTFGRMGAIPLRHGMKAIRTALSIDDGEASQPATSIP